MIHIVAAGLAKALQFAKSIAPRLTLFDARSMAVRACRHAPDPQVKASPPPAIVRWLIPSITI
jgi:hypothetical protein